MCLTQYSSITLVRAHRRNSITGIQNPAAYLGYVENASTAPDGLSKLPHTTEKAFHDFIPGLQHDADRIVKESDIEETYGRGLEVAGSFMAMYKSSDLPFLDVDNNSILHGIRLIVFTKRHLSARSSFIPHDGAKS